MKILQILPYYAPAWGYGGPPRVMYNFAKGLVSRGHRVTVYTTDAYTKNRRIGYREKDIEGVKIHYFPNVSNYLAWNKKKFFPIGFYSSLRKTIRGFDLVHISAIRNYLNMVAYPIIKKNKIPYVIDAHGSLPIATPGLKKFAYIYDYFFAKPMLQNANLLFAQTKHEAEKYRLLGGKEENIRLIPLPIDLGDFQHLPDKEIFKKKYKINNEDKIITFLGRINQGKGLHLLINIFRELLIKEKRLKLVIIGRNDGYLEKIEKMILDYNLQEKVIFTGALYGEEKLGAYVDTDLFVFTPLYWEETSTASLEACVCYTPVVVTKQAEIPYLEEYKAGFCLGYNRDKIIEKIWEILGDEKRQKEYAFNARRLIEEKFNLKEIIEQIEQLFINILKKDNV